MTDFLLMLVILLVLADAGVNLAVYVRLGRKGPAREPEERDDAAAEELRRSREMDEGVENLMGYTVKLGRGRSTGGEL